MITDGVPALPKTISSPCPLLPGDRVEGTGASQRGRLNSPAKMVDDECSPWVLPGPEEPGFPLIFFAHCPLRCADNGKSFRGLSGVGLMPPEVRAIIPACDAAGTRYPAGGVVDPMLKIHKTPSPRSSAG